MDLAAPPSPLAVLWAAWLMQAGLTCLMARKVGRLIGKPARPGFALYRPHASVIVPFKGVDPGMADGLAALFEQDYPAYRLVLVVESESDEAVAVLREQIAAHPDQAAEIVVAGAAPPETGQKVHNQLAALASLEGRLGDEEVLAFADSDAVPDRQWLGHMVGPLSRRDVAGLTTGYRWLVPEPGAGFWSHAASLFNASVATLLGLSRMTHAWGGAMAMRADTARRGGLRSTLTGVLTDDYPITQMVRRLGEPILFVDTCLVATPADFSRASLLNFAYRQYLLTRVYAPVLFWSGLGLTTLYVAGLVSAWAGLAAALLGAGSWLWPALTMALVFALHQVRASIRGRLLRRAFGDDVWRRMRATRLLDRWATSLWMALHWLLIVRSLFGRTMTWRGVTYKLDGPKRVRRVGG